MKIALTHAAILTQQARPLLGKNLFCAPIVKQQLTILRTDPITALGGWTRLSLVQRPHQSAHSLHVLGKRPVPRGGHRVGCFGSQSNNRFATVDVACVLKPSQVEIETAIRNPETLFQPSETQAAAHFTRRPNAQPNWALNPGIQT